MRTLLAVILLSSLAACTARDIGGDGDACNNCSFATLEEHPIPIASCKRESLIITCQWADLEAVRQAPLDKLQASMSLWLEGEEQIQSTSNDNGVVTYDLGPSSWQPGERILFKSGVHAAWSGGELEPIGDSFQAATSSELASGLDIYSRYEFWDVGLLAELSMLADLSFEGAMTVPEAPTDVRTVANVFRFIVDPDEGVKIYSGGTFAGHVDRPGYYLFLSETAAVFEPKPTTVD